MSEMTFHVTKLKHDTEKNRYSLKSPSGVWFSAFGSPSCKEGDEVKVSYTVNGAFNNIDRVEVLKSAATAKESTFSSPALSKQPHDKALMLTSYSKDIIVALIASGATDVDKAAHEATALIMKIYDTFTVEVAKSITSSP